MILVIDNYDSFVHTLARYIAEAGAAVRVQRNDAMTAAEVEALAPSGVVLSPGPGRPQDAGHSIEIIRTLAATTPILGVCLGHQAIAEAFGGRTVRAAAPMHGRSSEVRHMGTDVLAGLPSPLAVGRYHSLASDLSDAPELTATAVSAEGDVMALAHRTRPLFGVQFHPESVLTPHGRDIIKNFIRYTEDR